MHRRLRLVGALVALMALSAYFAEGVWASMCMPGTDVETAAHGAMDGHAGMSHAAHAPADDSSRPDTEAPDCPLGMAGMGSSCVVVSLPASVESPVPAVVTAAVAHAFADSLHDSLLTAAHFRPPRA
jgi:hypothetical protein